MAVSPSLTDPVNELPDRSDLSPPLSAGETSPNVGGPPFATQDNRTESCDETEECTTIELANNSLNRRISFPTIIDWKESRNAKKQRKSEILNELHCLRKKISGADIYLEVQKILSLMKSLKALERQEADFQTGCDTKHSELEAEIADLERKIANEYDMENCRNDLACSYSALQKNLHSAKKELAARLRAIMSVRQQLDDVSSQSELAQYEQRLSELNLNIEDKHKQTQKYYATFNALLEMKESMLKEISLLNSINSQFQDALVSTAGRVKLINSMEGILKGIQQKLDKLQVGFEAEQNVCSNLRNRYAGAAAEKRRCFVLERAFQEELMKNQRLQSEVLLRNSGARHET